jgi:hypothetical protein
MEKKIKIPELNLFHPYGGLNSESGTEIKIKVFKPYSALLTIVYNPVRMYPALKLFQSTGTKNFHAKAEFFTSPLKNESGT